MLLKPPTVEGKAGLNILKAMIEERSLLAGLSSMHNHLGDAFQISLPGFSPMMFVGPEANRDILINKRDHFLWRNENDPVTRLLGHGLLVEDGNKHQFLHQHIQPFLKRESVTQHIQAIWQYTDQVTSRWDENSIIDILPEMRRVTLLVLLETLFGVNLSGKIESVWQPILRVLDFIAPGLWLLWTNIPRLNYDSSIQKFDQFLYEIIEERRRIPGKNDNLLTHLVTQEGFSDKLIRDQLLTLIIAGHDTSTALLSWSLLLLGKHPKAMARVQEENSFILGGKPITTEKISKLQYLDQVIKEALRLYPPIHVGNRITNQDTSVNGYFIPEGKRVMYSIYLSHRNRSHWEEPTRFIPERFDLLSKEKPPPLTYIPFGAGPRNCIGAIFAQIEAKVILSRLFQTHEFELSHGKVTPYMGATLEPRPGVKMRVHRKAGKTK